MTVEKYRELVRKAIGSRTQKDFAEIAGLSPYNLNRMLNDPESSLSSPRKSTLQKIADASEGRVSYAQLMKACGYPVQEAVTKIHSLTKEEQNFELAKRLCDIVSNMFTGAMKYSSIEQFMETILLSNGWDSVRGHVWRNLDYTGAGHKGAERMAHCSMIWRNMKYDCRLDFTLFYCETAGGGVIILDSVFDLATLLDLHHDCAGRFLFSQAEKGDVNCTDYPMVFACKDHVPGEAERRLLKAIFGESEAK